MNKKHGKSYTSEYAIWKKMKSRCSEKSKGNWRKYWYNKNIRVCPEWSSSFENFYNDMGKRPSKDHTLDRKDNSKGYDKDNCRWVTWDIQNSNRTVTKRSLKYRGVSISGEKYILPFKAIYD